MNDFTASAAGAPAADPDASYAAALQSAMDAPTPQARAKAVDALEALAKQRAAGAPIAGQPQPGEPAEGLEAPSSATGYHLESHLPPGVAIENEAALGSLKSGLHELGVPASIASAALGHIAELHRDGAFQSDQALHDAVIVSRNQIKHVHGEAADALLRDAATFIDRAVAAGKITAEQADAICASPLAVSHAAMLARNGATRR